MPALVQQGDALIPTERLTTSVVFVPFQMNVEGLSKQNLAVPR